MAAKPKPLTDEERRFVEEYLIDRNGVRAWRAVHNNGQSYAAAAVSASQLLKKPKIIAELAAADAAIRRRCRVSAERVVREIAAVAFSDIGDHVDYARDGLPQLKPGRQVTATARKALKKIKIKTRRLRPREGDGDVCEEVEEAEIELYDKLTALEKLAKQTGLFKDETALATMLKQLPEELRAQVAAAMGAAVSAPDPSAPVAPPATRIFLPIESGPNDAPPDPPSES